MVASLAIVAVGASAADICQQEWPTMIASEGRLSFISVIFIGLLEQDMFDSPNHVFAATAVASMHDMLEKRRRMLGVK
jgi:hypothetical protein